MAFLRMSGLALAAVLGLSLPIGQATAMPANGLAVAVNQVPKRVEDVRLVCGPYRCWSTGWGWHRPFAYWGWRRPLYAYAGPGWGWRRPLYAYAGPGWGWRRPLYAYAGPGWGWRRPLYAYARPGWGWRRPLYAYAGPGWGWRRPLYAYAGPGWGWRRPLYAYAGPGWGWRRPLYASAGPGWGWRRPLYAYAGGSIPGTAVGIPDTPGQPVLRLCGHEYLARMGHVEHVVVSHPCDVRHHQTNSVKTT
jgi:hypothetical protein